jgi:hypothetical protein
MMAAISEVVVISEVVILEEVTFETAWVKSSCLDGGIMFLSDSTSPIASLPKSWGILFTRLFS